MIRQPIVTFLGHVDHGKTSIQDFIRSTSVMKGESGAITQAIGASIIPLHIIKKVCGRTLDSLNMKFTIPGILMIDSPGHAAFTNLRKRGGNLADIAILVINIKEGIKPQTLESIEILKNYKTPFIIAANKLDLLAGWQTKDTPLLQTIQSQQENVQQEMDKLLYTIVGKLSELGFESERFDRIQDYTKQIAIVPTSAHTGEGIPELLMVIAGLAQKFLEKCLDCNVEGNAKGTVLEVKDVKGLGKCMDVIIYDGTLKKNDTIVIGSLTEPVVTKVRGLFEPAALNEMMDKKSKFKPVQEAVAATGVRINATDVENVVAGMPIMSSDKDKVEETKEQLKKEVDEVVIETDGEGIVIKADTLGSLEALINLLREKEVPIKRATIGNLTKKDLADAEANYEHDPLQSVILGFNVEDETGICKDNVKVITHNVIYKVIEDFEKWQEETRKALEAAQIDHLTRPAKIEIMKGYVFRQSNPAVCGVDVLEGVIKVGTPLMKKDGKTLTEVKAMQKDQENIDKAEKNEQVAVSMENVTVGRQINEGDTLFASIPEEHFIKFKEFKKFLSKEEIEILKEIAEIKRKDNPVWGV